jgi:hypothetical protein
LLSQTYAPSAVSEWQGSILALFDYDNVKPADEGSLEATGAKLLLRQSCRAYRRSRDELLFHFKPDNKRMKRLDIFFHFRPPPVPPSNEA